MQLRDRAGETSRAEVDNPPPHRGAALGTAAFAIVIAAAVPVYLALGRKEWFFLDEWDFLADRRAGDLNDLFRPHNEHWSTLPILAYRLLWQLFGLRTYVPYQLLIITLHLTAAVLLWVLARRAGAATWVATLTVTPFVFFGEGRQDIVWAFQIGFVGSLAFGLAQLVLADHDGPLDRRDAIGLAFGAAALLCSGVAVTMVVVVAIAVFVRRGVRAAAFHAVPLGLAFAIWWLLEARNSYSSSHGSVRTIVDFVTTGISHAFGEFGAYGGVGLLIGVALIGGLVVAWHDAAGARRVRLAAPGALLIGAIVFLSISAYGRVGFAGPAFARQSRYLHLTIAMAVPALAVAVDALVRRWRIVTPIMAVLLLIGIPHNLRATREAGFSRGTPESVLPLAYSPLIDRVPASDRPNLRSAPEITVGWLRAGVASGRIPRMEHVSPAGAARAAVALSVHQDIGAAAADCAVLSRPIEWTAHEGDRFAVRGSPLASIQIALVDAGQTRGHADYTLVYGDSFTMRSTMAIQVSLVPSSRNTSMRLCR